MVGEKESRSQNVRTEINGRTIYDEILGKVLGRAAQWQKLELRNKKPDGCAPISQWRALANVWRWDVG